MKSRLLCFALVVLSLLALVACGEVPTPAGPGPAGAGSGSDPYPAPTWAGTPLPTPKGTII